MYGEALAQKIHEAVRLGRLNGSSGTIYFFTPDVILEATLDPPSGPHNTQSVTLKDIQGEGVIGFTFIEPAIAQHLREHGRFVMSGQGPVKYVTSDAREYHLF